MKTYAFIFARGGSKQIPNKNIKKLNGKPLIYYPISLAKKIPKINKVFVSTDSIKISKIASKYGAEIINRPSYLSKDNTPEWLAWKHAVQYLEKKKDFFDYFLSLPPTSPLRSKKDILNCFDKFDKNTDVVVTVSRASKNPWFNMVKMYNNNLLEIFLKNKTLYHRRQDTPKVFNLTTVASLTYPDYIKKNKNKFVGNVKGVMIPEERALDIDTDFDLKIAKYLIKNR